MSGTDGLVQIMGHKNHNISDSIQFVKVITVFFIMTFGAEKYNNNNYNQTFLIQLVITTHFHYTYIINIQSMLGC